MSKEEQKETNNKERQTKKDKQMYKSKERAK